LQMLVLSMIITIATGLAQRNFLDSLIWYALALAAGAGGVALMLKGKTKVRYYKAEPPYD